MNVTMFEANHRHRQQFREREITRNFARNRNSIEDGSTKYPSQVGGVGGAVGDAGDAQTAHSPSCTVRRRSPASVCPYLLRFRRSSIKLDRIKEIVERRSPYPIDDMPAYAATIGKENQWWNGPSVIPLFSTDRSIERHIRFYISLLIA
ncbi:hypothetical protein KIN20_002004 [Parelaphostrongylus tenuis]|uniref:Uncharacterized protein n=1 Tax=Parelaphostrongylus tenuis TaxID=148309 RepID=A0AAD5MG63_PARTN|nr:hypothetical protein KIN20_002004 [Parelaphostrongylus tenuis]